MVIKFSPEGRVAMVFGRKQEASDERTGALPHPNPPLPPADGMFRQVTDMAWDNAGNTYTGDGYINSRIAKVDKKANWIKSWGEPGDLPGQFSTPHSIAVDAKDHVYVADRGNRRIQVFDGEGKFVRQITMDVPSDPNASPATGNKPVLHVKGPQTMVPSSPWPICITPPPNQVLFSSDAYPGRIYKLSVEGEAHPRTVDVSRRQITQSSTEIGAIFFGTKMWIRESTNTPRERASHSNDGRQHDAISTMSASHHSDLDIGLEVMALRRPR
ncbi:MAG: hypothetical protein ACJ72H_07430 [Candidatus Sulfotelmatobacter sp.]|jgi:hypothetical protein